MASVMISLSPPLDAFVDDKVRSGAFRDRSDVVERALGLMRDGEARLKALGDCVDEGLDELDAGLGIEIADAKSWLNDLGR
ncbi:type II toxin-antitoxin system ParD family antitoxin [Brevundimonas sp.]|uniref:type II toxin-antitoxin system ParD family antitoxin n=1 Tax=Brevundimonas sp. TaxID=1871086 RepID=UPI002ABADD95|nr:type II toxin-antitoxin system ParD family antitoxin [Brevundimonas sp.]MDZ4363678.1 type II toxin-antitoxin system ParD family antitoxin [Brevundimonas sp.]